MHKHNDVAKNSAEEIMRMMVIADLHSWSEQELERICNYEYHCCILLGDIPNQALELIRCVSRKPIFGVLGNHDELNQLERCGIINLHGKTIKLNGITIAGFGGSHRYKDGSYAMLTQRESIAAARSLPPADILISHDTAYYIMGRRDKAHCGLKGISRYIAHRKVKLNLCGHYHETVEKRYRGCEIQCIYGGSLIEFNSTTGRSRLVRQVF